jgi:hypothetical protein
MSSQEQQLSELFGIRLSDLMAMNLEMRDCCSHYYYGKTNTVYSWNPFYNTWIRQDEKMTEQLKAIMNNTKD